MVLVRCICLCVNCENAHRRRAHCLAPKAEEVIGEAVSPSPRATPDPSWECPHGHESPLICGLCRLKVRKLGDRPQHPRLDWREVYRVHLTVLKTLMDNLYDFYEESMADWEEE